MQPRLTIGEEGISTNTRDPYHLRYYPYNEKLFLYSLNEKKVHQLTDAEAARRYFQTFNPEKNSDCQGYPGFGAWIF